MSSDRSRSIDLLRNGYTAPVAQQGRVILDRDFNALQGMTAHRIAADALDFVGPCGTPDDGFRISLPANQTSPPTSPPFWQAPESPPASPAADYGTYRDFLISPGTMYLGGERVHFPGTQNGRAITYSYLDQPDWPIPPLPTLAQSGTYAGRSPATLELVYLEVIEHEVSAVEDPDLLEVALGGPDTTQRLKLLRRIKRLAAPAADCADAWQSAIATWQSEGLAFDPATMMLLPTARLQVSFTNLASTGNPCDPQATGGYLYADNQLIRVQVAGSSAQQTLVWGYDNASFLYRVATVSPDGTILSLTSDPPDDFHIPQQGQIVEILTTAAVLGSEPDETDPTGQRSLLRVAAEATGTFISLKQAYGPATAGASSNSLVLSQALPSSVSQSTLPLFVRIWQAQVPLQPMGTPTTLSEPTTGISTGITVTLTTSSTVARGACWEIAARPATPQGVYPEDLLTSPQPPVAPLRWVCPLAVIDWRAQQVSDCRSSFVNLVTLSKRKAGCCTLQIDPSQLNASVTLQHLLDTAVAGATIVCVCLASGTYTLSTPLRLDSRHSRMTLETCGGLAARFVADPAADPALFADGLVIVANATNVTLRGLILKAPLYEPPAAAPTQGITHIGQAMQTAYGVRAVNARNFTLERCAIGFDSAIDATADFFGACVFLQGDCTGITIRACDFVSGIAPTLTLIEDDVAPATPAVPAAPDTPAAPAGVSIATARIHQNLARVFTPPKSSPPKTLSAALTERSAAALDLISVTRQPEVPAQAPNSIVCTVGVLASAYTPPANNTASTYVATNTGLLCSLDAASVKDCSFAGLTFATWISASAAILRLQDNRVTGCIAGLWLELPNGSASLFSSDDGQLPGAIAFDEFFFLLVVPPRVTPPQPVVQATDTFTTEVASSKALAASAAPSTFSLFVTGNQVALGTAALNGTAAVDAAAALLCALYVVLTDGTTPAPVQATIATNQMSTVATYAAAVVTIPVNQPCSITGNIIVNQGTNADAAGTVSNNPSLSVVVPHPNIDPRPALLSVTGNVLQGNSDLAFLPRSVGPARSGWSPYNADPS